MKDEARDDTKTAQPGLRARRAAPGPARASAPALDGAMDAGQALQSILENALAQLAGNWHGVLESEDIEYVHQARVAIRRLRSALRLVAAVVPARNAGKLPDELRWLGRKLGSARDWDVFVEQTLPPLIKAHPADAGLARLCAAAEDQRARRRAAARKALASRRGLRLLKQLTQWIETRGWRRGAARRLAMPATQLAARLLERRHQALQERGRQLASLPPKARHAARIAAKKLRYAAEFFLPLFPAAPAKAFINALSALQDSLGLLNDTVVTGRLLRELGADAGLDRALVDAHVERLAARGHARLETLWRRFLQQPPFWRAQP